MQFLTLDTAKTYLVEAYVYVAAGGPVTLLMNSLEIGNTGNSIFEWVKLSTDDYTPSGKIICHYDGIHDDDNLEISVLRAPLGRPLWHTGGLIFLETKLRL